jgi:hypothetical protein
VLTYLTPPSGFHYYTSLIKNSNNFSHNFPEILGLKVTIIVASVSNVMKYKLKSQSLTIKGFTSWDLTAEN